MKRPRDTGSESRMEAAAAKQNIECNTKSNNTVALEEIRAKLEQARMKKIDAEERLLRQRQQDSHGIHQREPVPSTPTTTKTPSPATTTATTTVITTPTTLATATATIAKKSMTSDIAATTKTMATIQTRVTIATPQGTPSNLKSSNITRAQEAQVALDRARSKLQGALQNRERALLQQRMSHTRSPSDAAMATTGINNNKSNNNIIASWNRKRRSPQQHYFSHKKQGRYNNVAHGSLPPISALSQSFSLRINDISRTGPPNMVYYCNNTIIDSTASCVGGELGSRAGLEAAQGGKEAIEALRRGSYWPFKDGEEKANNDGDDCNNNYNTGDSIRSHDDTTNNNSKQTVAATNTANKNHNVTSISLVQRKLQLQNELMALKEKLDMKSSQEQKQNQQHQRQQTTNATTAANGDGRNGKTATKEGLERRKAEAQTVMDISYWKHFVSKQEYLLEQVTAKINNMNDNSNHRHQKIPRGANTYKECLHERHATNKAIAKVQHDLDIIEKRQEVVEEGIILSTKKLLEARQVLHDERATPRKLVLPEKNETQIISSTRTAMTVEATKRKLEPETNENQISSTRTAMTVEETKRKFDPERHQAIIMESQRRCAIFRKTLEDYGKPVATANHREDSVG